MSDENIAKADISLSQGYGYQLEYDEASNLEAGSDTAKVLTMLFFNDWEQIEDSQGEWLDRSQWLETQYRKDGTRFIKSVIEAQDEENEFFEVWYWVNLRYEKFDCEPVTPSQAAAMLSVSSKTLLFLPAGDCPPATLR